MMIEESYIKELLARPLDLDTDLTDFIKVAKYWAACERAMEDLQKTNTLQGCDSLVRSEYIRWFYAEAKSRYRNLGRWYTAEPLLNDNPPALINYMVWQRVRHPDLEKQLLAVKNVSGHAIIDYTSRMGIRERWPEVEPVLLKLTTKQGFYGATMYAIYVLQARWPELEAVLPEAEADWYFRQLDQVGIYPPQQSEITT